MAQQPVRRLSTHKAQSGARCASFVAFFDLELDVRLLSCGSADPRHFNAKHTSDRTNEISVKHHRRERNNFYIFDHSMAIETTFMGLKWSSWWRSINSNVDDEFGRVEDKVAQDFSFSRLSNEHTDCET